MSWTYLLEMGILLSGAEADLKLWTAPAEPFAW